MTASRVPTSPSPGAEPHDLELTPSDVAAVSDADLVVYLEGFQPAVDDAVASEAPDTVVERRRCTPTSTSTYTPRGGRGG